jgi:hypothetical protein
MANQWLRLWHDMPTDPKWRTISKASGQRIGDVMAVYVHMLVCASNATERGRTQSFNSEDVASALDLDTEQVEQIIAAMQGRVLDGDLLKGWGNRQVAREDGSAERAKAWREAQKAASERTPNATERKRTPDKDKDKDKDKEKKKDTPSAFDVFWNAYPKKEAKKDAAAVFAKLDPDSELLAKMLAAIAAKRQSHDWTKDGGKFVPLPATWIRAERWNDESGVDTRTADIWAGAV